MLKNVLLCTIRYKAELGDVKRKQLVRIPKINQFRWLKLGNQIDNFIRSFFLGLSGNHRGNNRSRTKLRKRFSNLELVSDRSRRNKEFLALLIQRGGQTLGGGTPGRVATKETSFCAARGEGKYMNSAMTKKTCFMYLLP